MSIIKLKTGYIGFVGLSIAVLIVGVMFKILHWPFAGAMITGAYTTMLVSYTLRFLGKKEKLLNDYLKLIIVNSYVIGTFLGLKH